jgi:chromosome segregation ATPase
MTGDTEFNRVAERVLWALSGGNWRRTGSIRRDLGLNQNQQVIHQMDEHLEPAGLVERQRKEGRQAIEWKLTEEGREYVTELEESLRPPQTTPEACEHIRTIEHRLSILTGWVGQLEPERVEGIEEAIEGLEMQANTVRAHLEEGDQQREYLRGDVDELAGRVEEIESADLETEIDEIDERVESLEDLQEEIDSLVEWAQYIKQREDEREGIEERLDSLERDLEELEILRMSELESDHSELAEKVDSNKRAVKQFRSEFETTLDRLVYVVVVLGLLVALLIALQLV